MAAGTEPSQMKCQAKCAAKGTHRQGVEIRFLTRQFQDFQVELEKQKVSRAVHSPRYI